MNQEHIAYPSIEQFRTIVKIVRDRAKSSECLVPILKFHGTTKLHGTNLGISLDSHDNITFQSRQNIISFEKDNAGSAAWGTKNREFLKSVLKNLYVTYSGSLKIDDNELIVIYGEYCGQNIQKGVAISELPKMFVVFGVRIFNTETKETRWMSRESVKASFLDLDSSMSMFSNINMYYIENFKTWDIEINFNNPELVQNQIIKWTEEVEQECPYGKAFGVSGIGEGIVFSCVEAPKGFNTDNLVFKSKGLLHSVSKVKTIASVDIEKLNSVKELCRSLVTDNRCNQGIQDGLIQNGLDVSIENTGEFLKWVSKDIIKEETDTITGNGFVLKDVIGQINRTAKDWFMTYLDKETFNANK